MAEDTIFALSSGKPPAAIAVVRLSGHRARFALETLLNRVPEPRRAGLAKVHDSTRQRELDHALVLWLPGPRTETGEDMAELHLHGGRAVIAAVLAELGKLPGLRPAEAGEFTRRAFTNGRMDLTAVEGLGDLIGAETEAQRAQAMRQYGGLLGSQAEDWRRRLTEALALVEAGIDFSDEADVPEDMIRPALEAARTLQTDIAAALADNRRGERLRDGLVVAIAGPPNAGKSSLLNRIARREAAIVSPYAGTTRDVIEVHLDLDGYPVTLLDTAGIREAGDPVEVEGVRRARARAAAADLVLWVIDASIGETPDRPALGEGASQWLVRNKIDLASEEALRESGFKHDFTDVIAVSALSGEGIDALIAKLRGHVASAFGTGESSLITRERHRSSLSRVMDCLVRAQAENLSGREDLIAEEFRLAARELGRLTGRVDVEDILDVIFRDFCIGK